MSATTIEGVSTREQAVPPDSSRAERRASFDPADFPIPTGREEEWRFAPVDRLGPFFVDEATGACLGWDESLPDGVLIGEVSVEEWRAAGVPAPGDRAAAVAAARSGGVAALYIPHDADLADPVRIRLSGTDETAAGPVVHGHLEIRIGDRARATVVLEHAGRADYSEMLTVIVGDGAQLTLVTLQTWDDAARHLGQHDVVLGRDASARHIAVSLGGALVRLNVNATYRGPGGNFEALGIYFADAGQHLEHRLFVDHGQPHCRSNVVYKGALQGKGAHTVWIGDVLIRAEAQGTDTYEINRNLVLTDGTQADSVPNLEIETGQIVGAGHASATGRFDDEQVFYLCSRGIPEDEARRMVVRAFFAGIVQQIDVPDVAEALMAAIDAELAVAEPTEGAR